MKCPFCSHINDKVVDSRESKEGESIRRRRECLHRLRDFARDRGVDLARMSLTLHAVRHRCLSLA